MTDQLTQKLFSLPTNQRRAIESLLTNQSVAAAAAAAGVSRNAIYKWRRRPEFAAALREAEADALAAVSMGLASLGEKAIAALADALGGDNLRLRVRVADIVLGRMLQWRELVDFEARLTRLEEQARNTAP